VCVTKKTLTPNLMCVTNREVRVTYDVSTCRRTGTLLKHFGINAKQMSHHEHNWQQKAPEIVEMAQNGETLIADHSA